MNELPAVYERQKRGFSLYTLAAPPYRFSICLHLKMAKYGNPRLPGPPTAIQAITQFLAASPGTDSSLAQMLSRASSK
jgi:hypothetical protein